MTRTSSTSLERSSSSKIASHADLEAAFAWPLSRADQIRSQQQRQRGWKLYSFHAPEVECIGKGKASAPYEFGVKASVVTTNARAPGGQFVLHARTLPGNPVPQTRAASSSQAKNAGSSAASNASSDGAPPSRR